MASWRVGREVRSSERSPNPFAVSTAVRIRSLPTPCLLTLSEVTTSSIRARWPEMVLCRDKVRVPTTSPSLLATNSVMFGLVSTRSRSSCRSGWADDESSWRSAFSPCKSSSVAEPASSLSTTVSMPSSLMPALRTLQRSVEEKPTAPGVKAYLSRPFESAVKGYWDALACATSWPASQLDLLHSQLLAVSAWGIYKFGKVAN